MNAKTVVGAASACLLLVVSAVSGLSYGGAAAGGSPAQCDGSGTCRVNVSPQCVGTNCSGSVDHETVHLTRGKHDINIVWRLPPKFGFCDGDGVVLKGADPDRQFDQMRPSDEAGNPSSEPSCKRHNFHWRARNTVPRPGQPYAYTIVFHDSSNRKYTIDPFIMND
jgi:hypothetical protein